MHMTHQSNIYEFNKVVSQKQLKKRQQPSPVSVRFDHEERKILKRAAGKLSISAYIRKTVLGDKGTPRAARYTRKKREQNIDSQTVARLLGTLGQSELGPSMIAIALAAQSGLLPVTPELTEKLHRACEDINTMCSTLVYALKIKREAGE